MKKVIITIGVLFVATLISYSQQSESRSISGFSGIKVSEGIDVYLKKGTKEDLKIEASGIKLSNVITEVSGSYLKIHMNEGVHLRGERSVKVYVTYVALSKLSASSAANIFHEGVLKASNLELRASSAGNIELSVDCNELDASASSAGEIELEGKTKAIILEASSAGEIDAYNLSSDKAEAEASSGASVKLAVNKSLDAHASSGGSIRYRGNPENSNTNASSGGSVRKSN